MSVVGSGFGVSVSWNGVETSPAGEVICGNRAFCGGNATHRSSFGVSVSGNGVETSPEGADMASAATATSSDGADIAPDGADIVGDALVVEGVGASASGETADIAWEVAEIASAATDMASAAAEIASAVREMASAVLARSGMARRSCGCEETRDMSRLPNRGLRYYSRVPTAHLARSRTA